VYDSDVYVSLPAILGERMSVVMACAGCLRGFPPFVFPVLGASCVHGQPPVSGTGASVIVGVPLVGVQGGPAR